MEFRLASGNAGTGKCQRGAYEHGCEFAPVAPFVSIIPSCATAPALIFVGGLLLSAIKDMEFDDVSEAIPAYLALIMMPLTYSIANGIAVGLIAYTLIKIFTGKFKELNIITVVLSALFVIRYLMISL